MSFYIKFWWSCKKLSKNYCIFMINPPLNSICGKNYVNILLTDWLFKSQFCMPVSFLHYSFLSISLFAWYEKQTRTRYLFLHRKSMRNILTFNQYFKNLKLKGNKSVSVQKEWKKNIFVNIKSKWQLFFIHLNSKICFLVFD